jgi:hypothetical protein
MVVAAARWRAKARSCANREGRSGRIPITFWRRAGAATLRATAYFCLTYEWFCRRLAGAIGKQTKRPIQGCDQEIRELMIFINHVGRLFEVIL